MRIKVVGYIRCSTEEQASGGVTLASQRAKVEQYARLHELDLVDVIADAGVSAKSLDRPGLARALALLDAGRAAGVVVAKLDRLSRSVRDWNGLIESHFGDRAGKTLMSVSDSIDTRTAAGRLVLNVLMSVAQWERETICERTADALGHKKRRNERVGKVPYGWMLGPDGKTLLVHPGEMDARRLIRRMHREGRPLRAIGADLVARGFFPRSGKPAWDPSTLRHIALTTPDDSPIGEGS